jgi:hypothetical protein
MMKPALYTTARVLPGRRIEISTPELREGQEVQVIVVAEPAPVQPDRPKGDIIEFIDSLPDRHRSAEYWRERDREFQEERDSWDR